MPSKQLNSLCACSVEFTVTYTKYLATNTKITHMDVT